MLEDSSLRGEKKNQFVLRVFAFRLSPLFLTKRKVTLKLPPSTHSVSREHSATWPSPAVKGRLGSRWGCGEGATGRKEDQGAMCSAANPSQVTEAGGLGTKLMGTSKHGALWG